MMIKCPICDGIVRAVDTLDSEYFNGSYYDTVEGTCSDCGQSWSWIEVFTFDRVEDVILINANDHL